MAKANGSHKEYVGEMIGRTAPVYTIPTIRKNADFTKVNYVFWSKFRRGKAIGYELGGLFGQPIGRIGTAWTMGRGFKLRTGDENIDQMLKDELVMPNMEALLDWLYDAMTLGDSYLVINPDRTLTLVPADQMEVITDPLDYRTVTAYKITTRLDKASITDEYRLDGRTVTIKWNDGVTPDEELEYPNLIGMLPVVHLAWDVEANEVYGHPIYEALLTLFAEYDDVLRKSLDGVKLMGNAIPVIENAEDPQAEIDRLKGEDDTTWTNVNGTEASRDTIDLNPNEMLVLGSGARFEFKSPGQFTQDAGRMLEYLFLLMLQHSKIPEWAWGGAIASSKASVDSQFPAFQLFIESVQTKISRHIQQIAKVWLAYSGLVTIGMATVENVQVLWNPLTDADEELMQNWVQLLYDRGLITKVTSVETSGLVEDAQAEVDAADAEKAEAQESFDRRVNEEMQQVEEEPELALAG